MPVLATAGHVDHGKSTLVAALTGTDPDRLPEEKARGMTVDLGFASLVLPSAGQVGIVDVPGHQRFIHNMLAGMGGIDAALLVVDLTEGWMPQTEEHAEILALLQVPLAAAVLTKADLVEAEWREMVAQEVRQRLEGHGFHDVPQVFVCAPRGDGLGELEALLDRRLKELAPAPDRGWPRLWIDRVIKMKGAGVVVTGTLTGGRLVPGQEVAVEPGGLRGRIRGLQSHGSPLTAAMPGARVAVNLLGIALEQLRRGQAVVRPDEAGLSRTPVVHLRAGRHVPGVAAGMRLTCFAGTAEVPARVRLLQGPPMLQPNRAGLAQLELAEPLPLRWGDRLVLRDPGRQATAAGAVVADPWCEPLRGRRLVRQVAPPLRRRCRTFFGRALPPADAGALEALAAGGLEAALSAVVRVWGPLTAADAARRLHVAPAEAERGLRGLAATGSLTVRGAFYLAPEAWQRAEAAVVEALDAYHRANPLSPGMQRQTLLEALGVEPRLFDVLLETLEREGKVTGDGAAVRMASFRPRLSPEDEAARRRLLELLERRGFTPPTLEELTRDGQFPLQLVLLLVTRGELVRVSQDLVFTAAQVRRLKEQVRALAERGDGAVEVSAVRDALGSSRRFVIPLLEYLDRIGFTRREGDRRYVAQQAAPQPERG